MKLNDKTKGYIYELLEFWNTSTKKEKDSLKNNFNTLIDVLPKEAQIEAKKLFNELTKNKKKSWN